MKWFWWILVIIASLVALIFIIRFFIALTGEDKYPKSNSIFSKMLGLGCKSKRGLY